MRGVRLGLLMHRYAHLHAHWRSHTDTHTHIPLRVAHTHTLSLSHTHIHTHTLAHAYTARSTWSTSRPRTSCYSQSGDVNTTISTSYLEPAYLKQACCYCIIPSSSLPLHPYLSINIHWLYEKTNVNQHIQTNPTTCFFYIWMCVGWNKHAAVCSSIL